MSAAVGEAGASTSSRSGGQRQADHVHHGSDLDRSRRPAGGPAEEVARAEGDGADPRARSSVTSWRWAALCTPTGTRTDTPIGRSKGPAPIARRGHDGGMPRRSPRALRELIVIILRFSGITRVASSLYRQHPPPPETIPMDINRFTNRSQQAITAARDLAVSHAPLAGHPRAPPRRPARPGRHRGPTPSGRPRRLGARAPRHAMTAALERIAGGARDDRRRRRVRPETVAVLESADSAGGIGG